MIRLKKIVRQALLVQFPWGHTQYLRHFEVGFLNQPRLSDRAISDRCQVIQIEVALTCRIERIVQAALLLVLHLQFVLMHLQLTQGFPRLCK